MWGGMESCGRLAIGLLTQPLSRFTIRLQDFILPYNSTSAIPSPANVAGSGTAEGWPQWPYKTP